MDLGFIDMCLKSYNGKLAEDDGRRLEFFRGLWGVMADAVQERGVSTYAVPPFNELRALYRAGTPIFTVAPVSIDGLSFAKTAKAIGDYLSESGTYDADLTAELTAIDWTSLLGAERVQATSVDALSESIFEKLVEETSDDRVRQLAALVATLALYTFLEAPAKAIMDTIGFDEVIDAHPLHCPVCGGEPLLASVGAQTSSAGRGRLLYCLNCGTAWEFDRIRCAHCGTHDQTKLHYVSIEGDEDHRLAFCDECGAFLRTTFMESALFPISPLVEDVVMAPLAALGVDQAFQRQSEAVEKE